MKEPYHKSRWLRRGARVVVDLGEVIPMNSARELWRVLPDIKTSTYLATVTQVDFEDKQLPYLLQIDALDNTDECNRRLWARFEDVEDITEHNVQELL